MTSRCIAAVPTGRTSAKRIAAAIYEVSRAIDNDPFQVFSLHGVSLVSELKKRHVTITANEMSARNPALG